MKKNDTQGTHKLVEEEDVNNMKNTWKMLEYKIDIFGEDFLI
jgi:hypothetical protein